MEYLTISDVDITEPKDDMVAVSYEREGFFEPVSLSKWKEACMRGGIVFDVGSYTGLYAIKAAKLGVKAYAYEPNPVVYERLLQNIEFNRVEDLVTPINAAVGDHDGDVSFFIKQGTKLTSASSLVASEGYTETAVKMVKVPDMGKVVAIKADVEGAEAMVLLSLTDIINKYKPLVIVEVLDDEHEHVVTKIMKYNGYKSPIMVDDRNLIFQYD